MDLRTDILPHRDRLFRLALSITMDATEAEDVVQDTMLRAWEHRDEWKSIDNIPGWLMTICKNLALDKRKHLDRQTPLAPDNNTTDHPSFAEEDRTGARLEARESLSILHQLITQLPPPLDDLVRLRDIEGLSYREIAVQLHLSEDQVRVYLHRARTKIKERYLKLQGFGL